MQCNRISVISGFNLLHSHMCPPSPLLFFLPCLHNCGTTLQNMYSSLSWRPTVVPYMFVPIVNYAVALTIKLNFRLNCIIRIMTPSSVLCTSHGSGLTCLLGVWRGNDHCVKKNVSIFDCATLQTSLTLLEWQIHLNLRERITSYDTD